MYNYTLSIFRGNVISRVYRNTKEEAEAVYNHHYAIYGYNTEITGVQLWEHRKGKTIDNDTHAKIIKQYYI